MQFRCFNNVNRFGSPGNTLSPCSADVPTSNSGKHPYHIEHASSPVLAVFASPPLRRGRHFTFPQRGLPRLDHRICANVRSPSSVCASRAGLAVSHLFCLGDGARNLVCLPRRTRSPVRFRFGCSISMLGVLPHIFSRFPAPPRSLRCAGRECPCAPRLPRRRTPSLPARRSARILIRHGAPNIPARELVAHLDPVRAMRNPRDSSE